MLNLDWLSKSFIAMVCFVPLYLGIPFFFKNYGIRAEITLLLWLIGITLGMGFWTLTKSDITTSITFDKTTAIAYSAMLLIALTVGTLANIMSSQAVVEAVNPGIPIAIINTASVLVFLLSFVLAAILPSAFNSVEMSLTKIIGIFITIIGLYLISKN